MKLKIIESGWSGWSTGHKPKETEKKYDIKLNEKYVIRVSKGMHLKDDADDWVEEEREEFSFTIIEKGKDYIRIHTNQEFCISHDWRTISLHDYKNDFVITDDSPIKLVTPSMDAGDIYILSLVK